VFHCATASPSASNASNEELMYAVNVRGTEHVVAACKVRSSKWVSTSLDQSCTSKWRTIRI
jgi:dTDP-4-dehydrorhamnose reductase